MSFLNFHDVSCIYHGGQLVWWSSGFDTHLECERPRFDGSLRHWLFRSVGTHCYISKRSFQQKDYNFSWSYYQWKIWENNGMIVLDFFFSIRSWYPAWVIGQEKNYGHQSIHCINGLGDICPGFTGRMDHDCKPLTFYIPPKRISTHLHKVNRLHWSYMDILCTWKSWLAGSE